MISSRPPSKEGSTAKSTHAALSSKKGPATSRPTAAAASSLRRLPTSSRRPISASVCALDPADALPLPPAVVPLRLLVKPARPFRRRRRAAGAAQVNPRRRAACGTS
eukprot:scaffold232997_cov33-Tisochrysis_lutea.AAC.5